MIGKTAKILLIVIGLWANNDPATADGWQWSQSAKSMFQYVAEGYKVVATTYFGFNGFQVNIKEGEDASGIVRVPAFKGTLSSSSVSWGQIYVLQKENSVVRCTEQHDENNVTNNCKTLVDPTTTPQTK